MNSAPGTLEISGRQIGTGRPCFLIAEIAQAHDGSLGYAHAFIDLAASVGADAVKFQTHIAEAETTPLEPFRVPFSYEDASRFDYWRRMEFSADQWEGLKRHAESKDLVFLSSVFCLDAVTMLRGLGMAAWKVASGEVGNSALLDAMAETGEPVLLSSGMSAIDETSAAVDRLKRRSTPFGAFQCTSRYPTPLEHVGLNVIDEFRTAFGCPVGLSDHSGTPYPSLAAMARGAEMIEVHLAFHRLQFGPDTSSSLVPEEFEQLRRARDAFHILLTHPVDKADAAAELASMRHLFTKSLALRHDRAKGHVLSADDLTGKKPGTGVPADRLQDFVGRRLRRDVSRHALLAEDDVEPFDRAGLGSA